MLQDIIQNQLQLIQNIKGHEVGLEEVKILVYEYNDSDKEENELIQSKYIICPICTELCLINFIDYKINLNCIKNSHNFSNILLDKFN